MCLLYIIMSLPTDPSEVLGTPEYEEVYEERRAFIEMLLNDEADELNARYQQFPYRASH